MEKRYTNDKYLAMKVNSYLIQQIYHLLGNNRDAFFRNDSSDFDVRKKISYKPINEVLTIEKSKFNRILNEDRKTGYTKEESKKLASLFNVEEAYFQKENAVLFPIAGFDLEDWKILFNEKKSFFRYKTQKKMMSQDIRQEFDRLNTLFERAIKEICQNGIANQSNTDSPLYRIIFYFIHGRAYNNEQLINELNELINKLDEIDIKDWVAFQKIGDLNKAYAVLTKQFEIVDAIKKLEKYKN